jgi:hypothetical protein
MQTHFFKVLYLRILSSKRKYSPKKAWKYVLLKNQKKKKRFKEVSILKAQERS